MHFLIPLVKKKTIKLIKIILDYFSCLCNNKHMKNKTNNKNWKPRVTVSFNTGTRVEKPKKGKGSYSRKRKHKLALSF